jgi:hypothetical protein
MKQVWIGFEDLTKSSHFRLTFHDKVFEWFVLEQSILSQQSQRSTNPVTIASILCLVGSALHSLHLSMNTPPDQILSPDFIHYGIVAITQLAHELQTRNSTKDTPAVSFLSRQHGNAPIKGSTLFDIVHSQILIDGTPIVQHVRNGTRAIKKSQITFTASLDAGKTAVGQLQATKFLDDTSLV